MRFFGTIKIPKLDEAAYSKSLHEEIKRQFRKAALAYLRAATASDRIPVDTGMARGSFLNLAKFLRTTLSIVPKRTKKKNGEVLQYYHRPGSRGQDKTPQLAQQYSTAPEKILKENGSRLAFVYNVRVYHFELNDGFGDQFAGINANAPWGATEAGKEEFIRVMRLLKVPKVKKFMVKTTISVGSGSGLRGFEEPLEPIKENFNG